MAVAKNLFFLIWFHIVLLNSADSKCPETFTCGNLSSLEFPLYRSKDQDCGLFRIENCDSENPMVHLEPGRDGYEILKKISTTRLLVRDLVLQEQLAGRNCSSFRNLTLPKSPYSSFTISPILTLFLCLIQDPNEERQDYFKAYNPCEKFIVYYRYLATDVPAETTQECSMLQLPRKSNQDLGNQDSGDLFNLLSDEFTLEWNVSHDCYRCHHGGGQCLTNSMNEFQCKKGKSRLPLILALSICGAVLLLLPCLFVSYVIWQRKKWISGAYILSRNISSDPSSKSDIEGGSLYGIPIFQYGELEEATNNFDPSKELGDGGFGTVYYGKLQDGREVAIKRLYEHNYRRVEQFMNEIKMLTCLRHPNLVSLYGCTSRRSRELLLVYEYIPNGTVADHLHGERAKEGPLTWPDRMSIAIETASALAYLHKSEIIHRDVKTNNILLDNNFCVKVADFGLSRLFPNDVTHISTAPQGTPGYVDPEYQQCYQLTDKSDVYSFGVVLIELISSMPAVDIGRHRHEINLANLAVNRIQRCAFDELIDSSLGYESDSEVLRMTTSVAELAFRCLQLEKDMRPSMDEALDFLKGIQAGEDSKFEGIKEADGDYRVPGKTPPSPKTDDVVLLKHKNFQSSPNAVTDIWVSGSSTEASSIG